MLKHGDAAIEAKNYAEAMRWFNKAADLGDGANSDAIRPAIPI